MGSPQAPGESRLLMVSAGLFPFSPVQHRPQIDTLIMMKSVSIPYSDRRHAGRALAGALEHYRGTQGLLILGLPRGGIPVAYEVAQALQAPLDVFVVRKLGVPGQKELAMGAIASGGTMVLNEKVLTSLRDTERAVETVKAMELMELERREQLYRGDRPFPDLKGRPVILIDDGLATGATMRAALRALEPLEPSRRVMAVPVAAPSTAASFSEECDEVVCPALPPDFRAVGQFYDRFDQTTDDEVHEYLAG